MEQIEYHGSAPRGVERDRGPSLVRHALASGVPRQRAGLAPARKHSDAGRAAEEDAPGLGSHECGIQPPDSPTAARWWRVFAGQDRQLAVLRRWLALLLPDCDARDDVTCVASELAANAILHTASGRPNGRFEVEVTWSPSMVRVAVVDGGAPSGPRLISNPAGERGRGLLVVTGLAARTGVCGGQPGRVVWADVPWEDTQVPDAVSCAAPRASTCGFLWQQGGLRSIPSVGQMPGTPAVDLFATAEPAWQPGVRSAVGLKAAVPITVTESVSAQATS